MLMMAYFVCRRLMRLWVVLGRGMRIFLTIWQRHISSRVSSLLWRLLHWFLATDDALCLRGFYMVCWCVYGQAAETSHHLFIDCQRIRQVRVHFQQIVGIREIVFLTPHALLLYWQRCAPLRIIFRPFYHALFCGKFGRLVMVLVWFAIFLCWCNYLSGGIRSQAC